MVNSGYRAIGLGQILNFYQCAPPNMKGTADCRVSPSRHLYQKQNGTENATERNLTKTQLEWDAKIDSVRCHAALPECAGRRGSRRSVQATGALARASTWAENQLDSGTL